MNKNVLINIGVGAAGLVTGLGGSIVARHFINKARHKAEARVNVQSEKVETNEETKVETEQNN